MLRGDNALTLIDMPVTTTTRNFQILLARCYGLLIDNNNSKYSQLEILVGAITKVIYLHLPALSSAYDIFRMGHGRLVKVKGASGHGPCAWVTCNFALFRAERRRPVRPSLPFPLSKPALILILLFYPDITLSILCCHQI